MTLKSSALKSNTRGCAVDCDSLSDSLSSWWNIIRKFSNITGSWNFWWTLKD